jgi:hypothetical protein
METRVVEMEYRFQRQFDAQQLLINELRHEVLPRHQSFTCCGHLPYDSRKMLCIANRRGTPPVIVQVEEGKQRMAEMLRVTTTLPQRVKELESSVSAKASETEVRTASFPRAASPVEPLRVRP